MTFEKFWASELAQISLLEKAEAARVAVIIPCYRASKSLEAVVSAIGS